MNPTAFISYCWDSPGEKNEEWVLQLAQRLRGDGISVKLDKWEVVPGDPIAPFMQQAIARSNKVLIICTPLYKQKADDQTGAVGYESNIISAQIWLTADHRKFITILKEGDDLNAVPVGLQGKYHIRLNRPDLFEEQYKLLLNSITGIKAEIIPDHKVLKPEPEQQSNGQKNYNNLSFAVLRQYSRETIGEFIDHYRQRIIVNRSDARACFGIGICYLHSELYDIACRHLEKAISLSPRMAEYYYYHALSLVKGKKLFALPRQIIDQIQHRLECALQLDNQQAKYYCFMLMLYHEYFKLFSIAFPGQDIEALLQKSHEMYRDEDEIERLASLLDIQNPVTLSTLFNK